MDLKKIIETRRAYRSLEPVEITEELIRDLGECIRLAPSCFNNQPWRFVFVYEASKLKELHSALPEGNKWAFAASLIIAVFSRKELDCVVKDRDYFLFDTGMAVAYLILRATEMGLVAHPIAGYDEQKVKEILKIPDEMRVITLVIVGKHSQNIGPLLSEKQAEIEKKRPERLPLERFIFHNVFSEEEGG